MRTQNRLTPRIALAALACAPVGVVLGQPLDDPIPGPIPAGVFHVELEPLATGLVAPNWGAAAPGHADRLFVTDQAGTVWNVDRASGTRTAFLDVSALLVPLGIGGPGTFDERGLLGIAFHPDYAANGLVYTYTSQPVAGAADFTTLDPNQAANHHAVITEWTVNTPADPNAAADPGSARVLLRIAQPQFNHNGGAVNFGPDGMLYIALGDGGAADDQGDGHGPDGNGQDPGTILGNLLRIDPGGSNSANGAYGIPADNPFVGPDGVLDEIFAFGFRNPFRFSFDRATGDLWVGDVGQNDIEEVDVVVAGGNYGWRAFEGSFRFDANGGQRGFVVATDPNELAGTVPPVAEYDHDEGISVIGGFVYRGTRLPALAGRYVFGEFARTFSNDGRLFYLDGANAIHEFNIVGQSDVGLSLLGFGQDAGGELYVLANGTGVPSGATGAVLRIVARAGDTDLDGDVDIDDLLVLLGTFGSAGPAADFDGDGVVGFDDLLILLGAFGATP